MRFNPPLAHNISKELEGKRSRIGFFIHVRHCDIGHRRSIRLAHVDCVYMQGWSIVIPINYMDAEGCGACHWRFTWWPNVHDSVMRLKKKCHWQKDKERSYHRQQHIWARYRGRHSQSVTLGRNSLMWLFFQSRGRLWPSQLDHPPFWTWYTHDLLYIVILI